MELTDFLQLKKSEGYCIVGVEQTANSQSLQDYQFPEKTLLLLGYGSIKQSISQSSHFLPRQCVKPSHNKLCINTCELLSSCALVTLT